MKFYIEFDLELESTMMSNSIRRASSNNSYSIGISDFSRNHHKEEALQRKLKHLHDENSELEELIRKQQD